MATNSVCTPRSRSARAVSSAFSPAPITSTRRSVSSPRKSAASCTATVEIDTFERAIAGLRAHALAGRERVAEQPVRDRAADALDQRHLVGALDLTLDLGLADDHRVEPGGDREQVLDGLAAAQRVERAAQLGRTQPGLTRQDRERGVLGLEGVLGHEVELGPVAGEQCDRFVGILSFPGRGIQRLLESGGSATVSAATACRSPIGIGSPMVVSIADCFSDSALISAPSRTM